MAIGNLTIIIQMPRGRLRWLKVSHSFFSSPLSGNIYVVFFVDWLIQALGTAAYILSILSSLMYYLGMCLYIHTMVDDLKATLIGLEKSLQNQWTNGIATRQIPLVLAGEIGFHKEIIE